MNETEENMADDRKPAIGASRGFAVALGNGAKEAFDAVLAGDLETATRLAKGGAVMEVWSCASALPDERLTVHPSSDRLIASIATGIVRVHGTDLPVAVVHADTAIDAGIAALVTGLDMWIHGFELHGLMSPLVVIGSQGRYAVVSR